MTDDSQAPNPTPPRPKRRQTIGRPVKGKAAIRRLLREHLPPEVAAVYDRAPSLKDPAWQDEFGRALFALYIDAQNKALTAKRTSEQRRWHKIAKQQAEELRKLKYLEAQQQHEASPRDFKIEVDGMDDPEPTNDEQGGI